MRQSSVTGCRPVAAPGGRARVRPAKARRSDNVSLAAPFADGPRPLVLAHRGASRERPENTLEAFDRAVALGAGLEMDVHATADGDVVVIHDATVERTTNGHGAVRDMRTTELRALDAGCHFVGPGGDRPWAGRAIHVPQLAEVLARYPGVPINIDIKQARPSIVDAVVAEVRGAHRRQLATGPLPLVLTSADAATQAALRRAQPPCALGLGRNEVLTVLGLSLLRGLLPVPWRDRFRWPEALTGRALQMPAVVTPLGIPVSTTPAVVREAAAAAGLPIHLWEVDDPEQARAHFARGIAGVFTNDPAALGTWCRPRPAPPAASPKP